LRSRFLPEGRLLHTSENEAACASCDGLRRAMEEGTVLEGVAQLCDGAHNLLVSVGPFTGFLPREEAALGIAEGTTREIAILSRVGKPVCFQITALEESGGVLRPRLSRRRAQQAALDAMLAGLHPGCILPAVVTHLESFGAFVDIGCGVPSLIGIENISVSRIPHPVSSAGSRSMGPLWSSPRICPAWRSGKTACGRGTVCPSTSRLSCLSG